MNVKFECTVVVVLLCFTTAGNVQNVPKIVERALTSLKANGVEVNREHWLKDAQDSEKAGSVETAKSIMCAFSFISLFKPTRPVPIQHIYTVNYRYE